MLTVTPLSVPATQVVISKMPPFIKDELIMKELGCFGKFASPMTDIPLGCKNSAVKHVLSFRRHFYMFLNNRDQTLDINFKCEDGDNSYTNFATTERLKCFRCREIEHKQPSCPRRAVQPGSSGVDTAGVQQRQRGDSQWGNTREQEPGADEGNDTPRSQLEEVSKDQNNSAESDTACSDSSDTRADTSTKTQQITLIVKKIIKIIIIIIFKKNISQLLVLGHVLGNVLIPRIEVAQR